MKRVLVITYYWPPTGGSGVQRWLKFSKYFPSLGYQPVIYTPENPERNSVDETLLEDIPDEAEILSTKITEPYSLFKKFTGGNKNKSGKEKTEAINPINDNGKKSFKMKVALWIRANIFIPDPRFLWIKPSVKYLEKYLKEHPVDAIVSTGPPHSMHLIAADLHKNTGIKWIADFRDPWTNIFYFKHLPLTSISLRKHMKLEQKVLDEADSIVGVTASMCDYFRSKVNDEKKVHLIENGYDEDDFNFETELDDNFTIVHTGIFMANANPGILWEVLSELCKKDAAFKDRMRIELIGKCDREITEAIKTAGLESNLIIRHYLPHNKTNKRQKEGRILILPLPEEPESKAILTGKFFEYIAAGRPILAFGPHDGVLDMALQKTGTGKLFDKGDKEDLFNIISSLYENYSQNISYNRNKILPLPTRNENEIKRYSRKELAKVFIKLLD